MGRHIYRIDELCNTRLGLPALSGNTLSLQRSPEEILHSIIRDIEKAQSSIRMVFYIWHLNAGIQVVQALEVSPWRIFLRRLDLRQHRKIIVIDDEIAYTGSMNLVDPAYFKQSSGVGQWVDIMVRLTGPTVNVLSA